MKQMTNWISEEWRLITNISTISEKNATSLWMTGQQANKRHETKAKTIRIVDLTLIFLPQDVGGYGSPQLAILSNS